MAGFSGVSRAKGLDGGRVRRNFSCHAAEYDRFALVQKRVVGELVRLLRGEGEPDGLVLEVGTGTGLLTAELLRSCIGVRPVVSDLAHGMTMQAAARLHGIPAVDADARALPVRDGSFDLVLSSSVYQWVEDLTGAFREASRVLAPGGRFAFALFAERTLEELREAHRQAAAEVGASSHVQEFPTEGEVSAALEKAGFRTLRLVSAEETEWHPDVPCLLRALKRIGAGNAASGRPEGLASRRIMQRMIALYDEKHRRGERIPATYHVLYAIAGKSVK